MIIRTDLLVKLVSVNRYFHPDHSATGQLLSALAFDLAKQGIEVSVVTSRQRYDDLGAELAESESVDGVRICRIGGTRFGRLRTLGRLLDYVSFIRGARKALKDLVDSDTIVVAKTDPPMLGMFLNCVVRRRKGRLENWLQDLFPATLSALSVRRIIGVVLLPLTRLRNRGLKNAALNVVIGERVRDYLIESGVPPTKLA